MNTTSNTSRTLHRAAVRLATLLAFTSLSWLLALFPAHSSTIDTTYRGFVTSNGQTSDSLGQGNSYEVGFSYSTVTRRDYFYFAIPSLAPGESITSARITLESPSGSLNLEGSSTRTVTLWDVSVDIGQIASAYTDIGSGNSYGSFQVSRSDPTFGITAYNADLNATAIVGLNAAAGGLFGIGGTLDVANNGVSRYQVFANTGGSSVNDGRTILSITTVPEPSAAHLLIAAGLVFFALRFARRCRPVPARVKHRCSTP